MSVYDRLQDEKQIVAFCGKKRSGKDTAADALASLGYHPIAFADPIKDTCQTVFQWDNEHVRGEKKEEVDPFWEFSPRWAMQTIGTELFRDGIDEDVWVKSLLARIDASDKKRFAVTDVRFPNEVEHLQKAGADLVYIRRPEKEPDLDPKKKWIAEQGGLIKKVASLFCDFGPEYHASEISLDDHPVTDTADVVNDGTVDQFRVAVRDRVRRLSEASGVLPPDAPYRASQVKT
jgi:hypothetical protein